MWIYQFTYYFQTYILYTYYQHKMFSDVIFVIIQMDERWFEEKETSLVDFAFKIYKDYFNEKYKD